MQKNKRKIKPLKACLSALNVLFITLSYLTAHLICDISKHHFPGEFALTGGHGVASVSPSDPPV